MLDLHPPEADKQADNSRADAASQEHLQRLIDSTDKQIDELVYELYEVSEEERKVVEGK